MNKIFAAITFGIALSACAPLPPPTPQSPPTAYVAASRSVAECMALSHGADADTYAESRLHLVAGDNNVSLMKRVYAPDGRIRATGAEVGPATLFIRFNEQGLAVRDSVRVTRIPKGDRMRNLIKIGRKTEAWPLVREGCAVPSWSKIEYGAITSRKN